MKTNERIALDTSAMILYFRGLAAASELLGQSQEIYLPLRTFHG